MKYEKNNIELANLMGMSRELTENTEVEARVYNDIEMNWAIDVHPPLERKDLLYFKIYNNNIPGTFAEIESTKCCRISMISPEYIYCGDCSKETWILTKNERDHLCKILKNIWESLLDIYSSEASWAYGEAIKLYIPMPDYNNLPILPIIED